MTPEQTRKKFGQIIKTAGGPSAVAVRLNCSAQLISRFVDGKRTPGMKMARAIQELYKIPMQDWLDAPRIEMVEKIA